MDKPGKYRGLQSTSNERQIFTILAVDHGASLAGSIQPNAPEDVSFEQMVQVKQNVLTHLAAYASATLIDPVYGLAPAFIGGSLPGNVGTLLAVEDGDYASVEREARLFDGWSVAQAKLAGANAIKCFFYYHPDDAELAAHQEGFVKRIVLECADHDIPLFAEPLSYNVTSETRRAVVIETARRVSRWGIDVLKVEFPVNVYAEPDEEVWMEACEALTAVCQTPWALLSAGVDFEMFARQVKVACQAGASGYLAGRAIWKDGVVLSGEAQLAFWQQVAQPRLVKLATIATEHGRPWTDFYPFLTEMPKLGWYKSSG
ncbi:MAG: tagatose 1,6-diphosphate aldolase [Chloroflexi bacterium]|nr:tagatose 1,6-diphosphate aldolase [Chloroflexota bacterium]